MIDLAKFNAVFGVWDEVKPHIALIVDEDEMQLVMSMQGRAMTIAGIAELLCVRVDDAARFVQRSFGRGILNKDATGGLTTYSPADLYTRLDYFCLFDPAWDALPEAERHAIDRSYLNQSIARKRPYLEQLLRGDVPAGRGGNDSVLLLAEVEEMIRAASLVALLPCDCRRIGQHCSRPVETCLSLDEGAARNLDRGHGKVISIEDALELARWADRKGLMHTGDRARREHGGPRHICNCCACDCFPFRTGIELGLKGLYPRQQYVARRDPDRCTLCGLCVKRCQFGAFHNDGTTVLRDGKKRKNVRFDADKCWGCGLCANTCPEASIVMEPLAQPGTSAPEIAPT